MQLIDFRGNKAYPDSFWANSSPESEGLDSEYLLKALEYIDKQDYEIHSFLVIRHEKLVFEYYGRDKQAGGIQLTPNDLHKMWSTTKTITSALIGIAIDEGFIPGVKAKVMDYFRDDGIINLTETKEKLTIEDLLTMQSGLDYSEDSDSSLFSSTYNSSKFFLDRPMVSIPGYLWNYSTGNSQILAEILRKVTAKTLSDYCSEKLFLPMGIVDFNWLWDKNGTYFGGWGLSIKPRDLARFGCLYLKKGLWKDRELVPSSWVETSTKAYAATPWAGGKYGYHCWIPDFGGFATLGKMGQSMYIFPDKDLIAVFTAALPIQMADTILNYIVENYVLQELN